MRDSAGSLIGDLDVVAVDLRKRRGIVMEVKWPAEPDSVEEGSKADLEIRKGQDQALKLRLALTSGTAEARFPSEWGSLAGVAWEWFVLCGTHHTSQRSIHRHAVPPISWDQLWRIPSDDLEAVSSALHDDNRLPEEGEDFRLIWEEAKIDKYTVRLQKVELLSRE